MENLPLLVALLAVDSLEMTDDGVFLNEDQLQVIEQHIAASAQTSEALSNSQTEHQNDVANLQQQLQAAQNDLTAAQNTISERDATIEQLTKGPATPPAAAATQNDSHEEGSDNLSETIAELPTAEAIAELRKAGFNY